MSVSATRSPIPPLNSNVADAPRDSAQLAQSVPTGLYIGGSWRESADAGTIAVENPATGEILAEISSATVKDGVAALDAAEAASFDWARTPARERGELLRR